MLEAQGYGEEDLFTLKSCSAGLGGGGVAALRIPPFSVLQARWAAA